MQAQRSTEAPREMDTEVQQKEEEKPMSQQVAEKQVHGGGLFLT